MYIDNLGRNIYTNYYNCLCVTNGRKQRQRFRFLEKNYNNSYKLLRET